MTENKAVEVKAIKLKAVAMTNKQYALTDQFKELCEKKGIVPTSRQVSKFRNKRNRWAK